MLEILAPVRPGPRNRRRLAIGGSIALAAGAAAAALVLFTGSSSPRLAKPPSSQLVKLADKIVGGMTKEQVLRAVGKPATRQGRCWQYPVAPGPGAAREVVKTVVGVCFFAGRVSDTTFTDYVRRNGKLVPLPPPNFSGG